MHPDLTVTMTEYSEVARLFSIAVWNKAEITARDKVLTLFPINRAGIYTGETLQEYVIRSKNQLRDAFLRWNIAIMELDRLKTETEPLILAHYQYKVDVWTSALEEEEIKVLRAGLPGGLNDNETLPEYAERSMAVIDNAYALWEIASNELNKLRGEP